MFLIIAITLSFFFISKPCSKIAAKYIYLPATCSEVKLFYIANKNLKVTMIIFTNSMNNLNLMTGKTYFIMIANLIVKRAKKSK